METPARPCRRPRPSRHDGQFGKLGEDFFDDVAMHVGQTEVTTGVAVRQALVIEPQELEHRGVQVMDVDLVFDGLKAEFIGLAVEHTPP